MSNLRVATDFEVGQEVICSNPQRFISSVEKYLTNRTGIVQKVYPKAETREQEMIAPFSNRVRVEWQKRNGRGKTEMMWMHPDDIEQKVPQC